jgi:hypothetical protein
MRLPLAARHRPEPLLAAAGLVALAVCLVAAVPARPMRGQEAPLPDFDTFVAQAKTRLRTDAALQSGYVFSERQTELKIDRQGRTTDRRVRVYEVYPPLPGEDAYRRLIEEDGRPVPASRLEKQDRERRKKVEAYARELAQRGDAGYRRAEREYQQAVNERAADIDDIFNVFDVRMIGRDVIAGHPTIAFTLTPRPGAKARTKSGAMMRHFTARAWISEAEYQLVKVDVEAVDSVSWGLGLLARLHRGATASYERRKINDEVWLPARVTYGGSGRVLLVRTLRRAGSSEFFDYRKFSVETTTTVPSLSSSDQGERQPASAAP